MFHKKPTSQIQYKNTDTQDCVSRIPESPPEPPSFMQQLICQKHSAIQKWAKS